MVSTTNFSGVLSIIKLADSSLAAFDANALPETIYEKKQRLLRERRQADHDELTNHLLTQNILETFGGHILNVETT